jgi:hypothetical protein
VQDLDRLAFSPTMRLQLEMEPLDLFALAEPRLELIQQ